MSTMLALRLLSVVVVVVATISALRTTVSSLGTSVPALRATISSLRRSAAAVTLLTTVALRRTAAVPLRAVVVTLGEVPASFARLLVDEDVTSITAVPFGNPGSWDTLRRRRWTTAAVAVFLVATLLVVCHLEEDL